MPSLAIRQRPLSQWIYCAFACASVGCRFEAGGTRQSSALAGESGIGGATATGGALVVADGGTGVSGATSSEHTGGADTNLAFGGMAGGGKSSASGGAAGGLACLADIECLPAGICNANRCAAKQSCINSLDCSGQLVCDRAAGNCVECVLDGDCGNEASHVCTQSRCRKRCTASADCGAPNTICDAATHACVACRVHADCGANEFCSQGSCIADRCAPGTRRCSVSSIETCSEWGDGYVAAPCPVGQVCASLSGEPVCVIVAAGGATGAGGASTAGGATGVGGFIAAGGVLGDGGTAAHTGGAATGGANAGAPNGGAATAGASNRGGTSASGGAGSGSGGSGQAGSAGTGATCASTTVDACSWITEFKGSQIVDAKADEFCAVPSFALTFANAAKVVEFNGVFGRSYYPERAIVQVAWSVNYVHAFVRVTDPFVVRADSIDYIWGADSVELMISANRSLTGSTADDPSAIRIIAAPWKDSDRGMGASVRTAGTTGYHTQLPADQYAVSVDAGGYSVELKVPWPNGYTVGVGTRVSFDFALNAAVEGITSGATIRDAQAVHYQGVIFGASPCGSDVQPYCDDRTWCSSVLY